MPKRIIGVSEKLLKAARKEFLEKGYNDASIKVIATEAGTSPRAVYTRFKNKEDLFCSLVDKTAKGFEEIFLQDKKEFWDEKKIPKTTVNIYINYLEYAYKHKEDLILLIDRSQGTKYENFLKDLAKKDIEYVNNYAQKQTAKISNNEKALKIFVEQITYNFYDNLFIPLLRDDNIEVAREYVKVLVEFYEGGLERFVRG